MNSLSLMLVVWVYLIPVKGWLEGVARKESLALLFSYRCTWYWNLQECKTLLVLCQIRNHFRYLSLCKLRKNSSCFLFYFSNSKDKNLVGLHTFSRTLPSSLAHLLYYLSIKYFSIRTIVAALLLLLGAFIGEDFLESRRRVPSKSGDGAFFSVREELYKWK